MEDFEKYGDYNEIDDEPSGKRSVVGLILKILIAVVCLTVVLVLGFRLFLFNSYPDDIKNIYFNDKLTSFYNEKNGDIGALTQEQRTKYDDPDKGNFFAENLIIIPDINQLQLSVRFNVSFLERFKEEYGVELDPNDLEFSLWLIPYYEGSTPEKIATPSVSFMNSKMMYRYFKLVFDDVLLDLSDKNEYWITLRITVKGVDLKAPYQILMFENTDEYSGTEPYKLSNKEKPEK